MEAADPTIKLLKPFIQTSCSFRLRRFTTERLRHSDLHPRSIRPASSKNNGLLPLTYAQLLLTHEATNIRFFFTTIAMATMSALCGCSCWFRYTGAKAYLF